MPDETFRHLSPTPEDAETVNQGRFIVAVIGINNYAWWPKLHNAVSDAQGIAQLFTEKFGFLHPFLPLLDEAATKDAILELVQDKLPPLLQPDDNLLLFFAGHGHTQVRQVGSERIETGFIVPVNARTDRWSDYIKIGSLLEDIGQLPPRHVLFILDACHSGFALSMGDSAIVRYRDAVRFEADLIKRTSRKVITSARQDQSAVDSGPLPNHSLFTGTLIQGFQWGKADLDGNGLVTALELGLFLQQQVGQASSAQQTPDFGSFTLDNRGEMIISLGDDNVDAVKARAFTALRYRKLDELEQLVAQLTALQPQSPATLYLQYRLHFARYELDEAIAKIRQLQSIAIEPGSIPLSEQDLRDLSEQIPFWKSILAIHPGALPVELTLLNGPSSNECSAVAPTNFAGDDLFRILNNSVARYKVKNRSALPAHLYFIALHDNGTLRVGPLFESFYDVVNGLAPGQEGFGDPFVVSRAPGLHETRIFYAPERIDPLVRPRTTASRSIMSFDQPVHRIHMKRILHEVIAPTLLSSDAQASGVRPTDVIARPLDKISNQPVRSNPNPNSYQYERKQPMSRTIYALLVGIDAYPAPVRPLMGCVNDINRVTAMLHARTVGSSEAFQPLVLTDQQATRQAIIDGFRQHLCQAGKDDVALFYYSGHGSQAPSPPEFWHLEPDRLDETLVCWDSRLPEPGHWDLADKELAKLIAEVAEKQTHVTVILDCCHSGSGTRNLSDDPTVRSRRVPTDSRLRPIESFIVNAAEASALEPNVGKRSLESAGGGWFNLPQGRHVVLSACRAEEEAKELHLGGEQRGAFSYYLLDTLQRSEQALTYRDLFKRVNALVRARVAQQAPQLEATVLDDLAQPFLGGALRSRSPYFTLSHDKDRGWVIDGGSIHGIPAPDGAESTLLALFPATADLAGEINRANALGTARVLATFPGASSVEVTLNGDSAPDPGEVYKAVVMALPLPPLRVALQGEAAALKLVREALATMQSGQPSLLVRESKLAEAALRLTAANGRYQIQRVGDAYPLVVETPGFSPASAYLVVQRLEHIARWLKIVELSNSATRLPADAVQLTLLPGEKETGAEALDTTAGLRLAYELRDGKWRQPAFRIKLTNSSDRRLFCMLLDAPETYGVTPLLPGGGLWLDPGQEAWVSSGNPIFASVPKALWQQGVTELRDTLKLIVTTDESDATLLQQDDLPTTVTKGVTRSVGAARPLNTLSRLMQRVATRAIGLEPEEDETLADWTTSEVTVTTVRPQEAAAVAAPGSRTVLPQGVTLLGHPQLKANARLTSLPQASRDAGNLTIPALLRSQPGLFEPLEFTTSRSGAPGLSVLELSDVADHTVVTPENPLVVQLTAGLQAHEALLPVGFDGEIFLPLGRAARTSTGLTVTLDRLPAPTSAGTRDLKGSVKILFQKLVGPTVGIEYKYPQLAVATVAADGQVTYASDPDQVRSRVQAAQKIVLYIHGIIGDTRGMVASARTDWLKLASPIAGIGSHYDLWLTFDYENLHTPIEENARLLKARLAAVGLGPGHGKTLHIVAHSMGGLVSRWLIEREGGHELVQHLTMLGTPNAGSPWPKVEDYALTALTLGINALTTVAWPASVVGTLVGALEKVDVSLEQMQPGSDFLQTLNSSADPGIPYTIIAGNTSIIPAALVEEGGKGSLLGRLWAKVKPNNWLHTVTAPIFFGQPNDIAVTVESIKQIPSDRQLPVVKVESACDHITYFSTEAGLTLLAQHVNDGMTAV